MDTKRFDDAFQAFMALEDSTEILDKVSNSEDQALLAAIAAKHPRESYRELVVPRIKEREAQQYVFLQGEHWSTQTWMFNLTGYSEDEKIEMYRATADAGIRYLLLVNIENQDFLRGELEVLKDEELRNAAMRSLEG